MTDDPQRSRRASLGTVRVEACVVSAEEGIAAVAAGADRLELCVDLSVGGLSPKLEDVRRLTDSVDVPVLVMVRPRAGAFTAPPDEVTAMEREVEALRTTGAAGFVAGVSTADGSIDAESVSRLVDAGAGLPMTYHRAFDELSFWPDGGSPEPARALEMLGAVGVARVLTGAGPGRAIDRREHVRRLIAACPAMLTPVIAGGIRHDHVIQLLEETGAEEIHARASAIPALIEVLRAGA